MDAPGAFSSDTGATGASATLAGLERAGTAIAENILGLVGKSRFFADFSREDIACLAGYMEVYRAQPGDVIIREKDQGDFMMLIVEGEVDILKESHRTEPRHMTSAGPGMTVGEMSMIDGAPRFASCVATRPTTFTVLSRDKMAKIILDHPGLGSKLLVKIVTLLSHRLRQTSLRLLRMMDDL